MKNTKTNKTKMRSVLAAQIRRICAIALVAVIGFSMAACGNDEKEKEEEKGLTITGLEKFKGKYAAAAEISGLIAAASIDMENRIVTGGKINGDSVVLNVWEAEGDEDTPIITEYNGNDAVSFYVVILKGETISADMFAGIDMNSVDTHSIGSEVLIEILKKVAGFGKVEVTFKNGTASGEFIEGSLSDLL